MSLKQMTKDIHSIYLLALYNLLWHIICHSMVMEKYRVLFADNQGFAAAKTGWDTDATLKVNKVNGRKLLEWFIVYGDSEHDAIQTANTIVRESLIKFLR